MVTSKDINYIIVQAGGSGTRMGKYCINKPKCLLPIDGYPLIFHLFNAYKNKNIIIIGDHLSHILFKYIQLYSKKQNIQMLFTYEKGTSAGLKQAVGAFIPDNEPFILTWSDLLFRSEQEFEFTGDVSIGLSNTFECRWRLSDGEYKNEASSTDGIAGFFAFKNNKNFNKIDCEKSFVRGFLTDNFKTPDSFYLQNVEEIGTSQKYDEYLSNQKCRFFNKIEITEDEVTKTCIDEKYAHLIKDEIRWYEHVQKYQLKNIPKLISKDPYKITRVKGDHCYSDTIKNLSNDEKEKIILNYSSLLNDLHSRETSLISEGTTECHNLYYKKTLDRVAEVKGLIPFLNKREIVINNKICKNIFHESAIETFTNNITDLYTDTFSVIHGDLTFSNSLVDKDLNVYTFDPRGSFGNIKIFGDKKYEWSKLYYSVYGNYDSINSKKFDVRITDSVEYTIESNTFEEFGPLVIQLSGVSEHRIKLLHSLIWLSLTGYVKEDIDSVLCSFYNGIYLYNEII